MNLSKEKKTVFDVRVQKALDKLESKYEIDGDGNFKLMANFENGRSQIGFITSETNASAFGEVRKVWSPALELYEELPGQIANFVLGRNMKSNIGNWALKKMKNGTSLLIFSTDVPVEIDPDVLANYMYAVFEEADTLEELVTNEDKL